MGKIREMIIDRFDGGVAGDPRDRSLNKYYHSKAFDGFSYKHKLAPQYAFDEAAFEGGLTTQGLFRFLVKNNILWGLGKRESDNKTVLFYWDTANNYWVGPSSGVLNTDDVSLDVFVLYKDSAYFIDLATSSEYVQKSDLNTAGLTNAETFWDGIQGNTDYLAQPVHFKLDDILYFFCNYSVYALNDSTWEDSGTAVIGFNSDLYISCACEYGEYLVIATNGKQQKKSTIFFWNRDSSLNTVSARFDLDGQYVYHLAVLNGRLTAIASDNVRISVKVYNGSEFQEVNYLTSTRTSAGEPTNGIQKYGANINNRLYFSMDYNAPGESNGHNDRLGIWALDGYGRLSLEHMISGATSYKGLAVYKNDFWAAYNASGVAKTGITYSTTLPSVYESLILQGATPSDYHKNKRLMSIGVATEALPADGQIVCKYRLAENSAWTTIFTNSTDDSCYHEAINIESTGGALPEFREIQFRVESTGGAVITGINCKYEVIEDNPS